MENNSVNIFDEKVQYSMEGSSILTSRDSNGHNEDDDGKPHEKPITEMEEPDISTPRDGENQNEDDGGKPHEKPID